MGGGSGPGASLRTLWMSLVGIPDLGVDGANGNLMVAIAGAITADFQLVASEPVWTLGDHGVLTYSGAGATAQFWFEASPYVGGGGDGGTWAGAISHNGDLIGGPVLNGDADLDDALRVAGAIAQDFNAPLSFSKVGALRRLSLATGDTVQPIFGKAENIVANQGFLEAFSMMAIY